MKQFWRDSGGASVVEFALLIAPFLLLLFGVIEVSRALWTRQALQDIATAAARCIGVLQAECADESGYDEASTNAFIANAATGRAVRLESEDTLIQTGITCDGLEDAVAVDLRARFDSVFPFEEILDFRVRACFVDWSSI